MLSRDYFEKDQSLGNDESQFCNFQPYEAPSNHTIDFTKFVGPIEVNRFLNKKAKSCFKCSNKDRLSEN